MSAVSGPGSGSNFTTPTGVSNAEANAILADLNAVRSGARPSGFAFFDRTNNVTNMAARVIADDKVTAAEVKDLVRDAYDFGRLTAPEKRILTTLLADHAAKFEPAARQALADFLGVANPLPTAPTAPTTPTTPTTPTAPVTPTTPTGPVPTDFAPKKALEKHGLSTTEMTTSNKYDGHEWDVGYYPYSGDEQYTAFGKFNSVFGKGGEDGHAYFEFYSNPPGGLEAGSWIKSGHISESNFEMTAGVDVTGNRPISNELYAALRESGIPSSAKLALLDNGGKQVAFAAGDKLVPTVLKNGKPVETDDRGGWDVVWRVKSKDGKIDETGVAKSRDDVLGLQSGVKFDFLDATGRMVGFNPPSDKMAECFKDGDKWTAYTKRTDGKFDRAVIDAGGRVTRDVVDEAQKRSQTSGKDMIWRVQDSAGKLKGDGVVGESYNMSWWGKCHNVASLSTSNMPRPKETVKVVNNVAAGETLALQYGNNVLKPNRDGSYAHEVRNASGAVTSTKQITADEAKALADANNASAVIVKRDGSLKAAEFTTFTPTDVDALTSHIGDGAVVGKGGEGSRFYAHPDILVKKDGTQIQAHIKEIKTASGKTETVGRREGHEFEETSRDGLRAPGMTSRVLNGGGRSMAFNIQDMAKLNEYRPDDIKEFVVVHPDGREETVKASDLNLVAWENQYDFAPDDLWKLHGTVGKDGSTVTETATGTQVWNYATRGIDTKVVDPKDLSASEKEAAKKPGMMNGTIEEQGKVFFETQLKTDGGDKTLRYWVKFDNDGNVTDYSYLSGKVPDFTWTQHVKDPYGSTWTGESQAPGISNAEVQRLYLASQGALKGATLPGGFITASDLKSGAVTRPQ